MIRDLGILGIGLWQADPITNEAFGASFHRHLATRDPYRGRRGEDGIVRVAGVELRPGTHDRTIAAVEKSFSDPYRGAKRRRWFPADLPVSDAEVDAAKQALADAEMSIDDIDALLVHSFLPDGLNPKNGPLIAHKLGFHRGLALEVNSVCNSALSQMMVAASMISSGQAKRVLCVQSIAYSRLRDANASASVMEADMASAFILGPVPGAQMAFSWRTAGELHAAIALGWRRPTGSAETPYWQGPGERLLINFDRDLQSRVNAEVAKYASITADEAMAPLGWSIADIELFVSHQPMSWFTPYMEDTLGLADGIAFSSFEEYANINSSSVTASLYEAKRAGRLSRGTRALLYCPAAGYTYGTVALRW